MQPKITGIALYPLHWHVKTGGLIPSTIEMDTVECDTSCSVAFANDVFHHLVCAGDTDGDYSHVFVTPEIRTRTGKPDKFCSLDSILFESVQVGNDGTHRYAWTWPNLQAFMKINAEYEVTFQLVKKFANQGPTIIWQENQGPFIVKLLPPPPPIDPTPAKKRRT